MRTQYSIALKSTKIAEHISLDCVTLSCNGQNQSRQSITVQYILVEEEVDKFSVNIATSLDKYG